jgi:putative copper export protein
LISTTYGIRLIVKLGLFGTLLALAAYNKQFLTPRILNGSREAGPQLCNVIRTEFLLIVLVLAAAVSLTLTEPPRAQRNISATTEGGQHGH